MRSRLLRLLFAASVPATLSLSAAMPASADTCHSPMDPGLHCHKGKP
jgi:hypothetical protein